MYLFRKAGWLLVVLLNLVLMGQMTAQPGWSNKPDSLFSKVSLDTLPIPGNKKAMIDTISNKPYTKQLLPVRVRNISGHLLTRSSIAITVPGIGSVEFEQDKIVWSDSTRYRWTGFSPDSTYSLKMIIRNNKITGTFKTDTASYRIRPIGEVDIMIGGKVSGKANLHVITSLNPGKVTLTDPIKRIKSRTTQSGNLKNQSMDPTVTADSKTDQGVMVVYSDNVAAKVGDPKALVESAVTDANDAYTNSGIGINLSLVHTQEINYDESGNTDTDLTRLQDSTDGFIDEVHQMRDNYGADMVILLTANTQSDQTGTVTGEAYEIMATDSTAFAVLRYDFADAPFYTLAHEVGHLQGADHNPEDEVNPYQDYGHGYTNTNSDWRTVMAYNINGCCSRVEFFSNPDNTYNGDAMGSSGVNNNTRVLNETATTVAEFRPPFPLEVMIQGPSYVRDGNEGEWSADVSGGVSPYNYTWSKRKENTSFWSQVSTSQTYSDVVEQEFDLKVEVTDQNSETVTSSVFHVYSNVKNDIGDTEEHPRTFKLYPNYPNPFNPQTTISYYLPEHAKVTIEVYTVTGRKLRTLVKTVKSSGAHEVTYEPENLSSGLYLARMKAEGLGTGSVYQKTISMTLLK